MAKRVSTRLSATEGRKFAFTVGTALLLFGAIALWRGHVTLSRALTALGAILGVTGVVIPTRLGSVYSAWMGVARGISRITTPIFMGLVFFVIITPVGLVVRLVGRNPVRHRPVQGSLWKARSTDTGGRGDMTNQF